MNQTLTDELSSAARSARQAQRLALTAVALCQVGDVSKAEEAAEEAAGKAGDTLRRLRLAGVPAEALSNVTAAPPLRLDQLDTPDVRALLDGIIALVPLAEKVDQARGRWYPDAPATDTKGTDLAETLHLLACRLHLEAFGPSGKE